MKNVLSIQRTTNSSHSVDSTKVKVYNFSYLRGDEQTYAINLFKDWIAQVKHIQGLKQNTINNHRDNLIRLFNFSQVAPWKLKPHHVVAFFESKFDEKTGSSISPSTYAAYCSSWRSFQGYMCDPERANEIQRVFNIRPSKFVNDENSIAVKRSKANNCPKAQALTPEEISSMDETFKALILEAYKSRSKSLLPLQRDRVMFHIAIHFALRISELVSLQKQQFSAHHDQRMKHFHNHALLTITGKNSVTGTVPMREPEIYNLLIWYLENIRPKILMRRKDQKDGVCLFEGTEYLISNLVFPSERGGVITPNTFRKRLEQVALLSGNVGFKPTPHTLRHTGCTLMLPLYSPDIAQKYMRHKNLFTTLGYYHPTVLDAATQPNLPIDLFGDES
ncbi:hypothetical protein F902_03123 [Acinetobacter higginsii]|jgi:site-specific recombinase XerD|uniref:Recombinase n=1 Tax=Acinetobacter higginsii TaxID=70347 RepID=N9RDA1_9GAMM|nr:hypothetical protein F902_03123 [Acinetobacter higginsii]